MRREPNRNAVRGLILDLDGTVCLEEAAIPGAPEAIQRLRAAGLPIVFVSNTVDHREVYAARLDRLGVPAKPEDIVQAPTVLRAFLKKERPGARLFVIGERPLLEQLTPDFTLTQDPQAVDLVVVSFDREFNWEKLTTAFRALRRGALFVATNIDATAPHPEGEVPDAGAVIGALEGCSERKLDVNVGKPSELMLEATLARLGLPPEVTLLVGDRLETDIAMGAAAGMQTALVLSGVTSRRDLQASSLQPDVVLEDLRDLPAWLGIPH